MLVLGLGAAIIMGVVLGLIGGGGSILTVPILIYIFKIPPVEATGYSLFVVGLASLFGSIDYLKRGLVNMKVGALFSTPALIGVYSVRRFGLPAMPEQMNLLGLDVTKGGLTLTVFAIVMVIASVSMIKGRKNRVAKETQINIPLIVVEGLFLGALSGFVGAGGGFIIIPALVLIAGLEMKVAVGTSLVIISINSLLGFIGDVQVMSSINWILLAQLSVFSISGIFLGTFLSRKIPSEKLKPFFGWFVLFMGGAILIQQLL